MKKLKQIPQSPGVYQMIDKEENVIYVGKAKNLRKRIPSYFQKKDHGVRIQKMVEKIENIKWTETESELEALILEANLIKELHPRYNIAMRDDKNFVYVKISDNEDFPRITTVRKILKDNAKYFGPFTTQRKIEKTFKILRKVLPFRTCTLGIEYKHGKAKVTKKTIKYPCLDHYIKKCISPCVSACTPEEYGEIINQVINFLEGRPEEIQKTIKKDMLQAASNKNFELAASLRDKLALVKEISQKQVVSDPHQANIDVVNLHCEGAYVYFNLFQIRNGKLINQENFTSKSAEAEENPKEALETFVKQYYEKAADVPKQIFVPEEIDPLLEKWLDLKFIIPKRGSKKRLLDLALKNAKSYSKQSRVKILQEQLDPLEDLQKILKLKRRPERIEGYDISHLCGTNQTGSMVVFEKGTAKKSDYRRFKIRKAKGGDDHASLEEVLKRRLNYLREINDEYTIKKALKKDFPFIKKSLKKAGIDMRKIDHKQFYVIKKKDEIVGMNREKIINGKHLLSSLWISEKERGRRLGHRLIRHAIKKSKAERIYLNCRKELSAYYEEAGFQKIKKIPKGLEKENKICERGYCKICTEGAWHVYDKKKLKDKSFESRPDLIIIDGGKGQLRAGERAIRKFKLKIPIIAIAKKEEKIFSGRREVVLQQTSEALKLVQRIRDEAHRFANEHHRKLRRML